MCAGAATGKVAVVRVIATLALLAVVAMLATGCGDDEPSAQEQARSQVCDARADIERQIDTLRGLTLSTASIDAARQSLGAIGDDLARIKDAQGDLAPQRKQDVQQALDAFQSQVSGIASDFASGLTGGAQAQARLEMALGQLASGFRTAFEPVDC